MPKAATSTPSPVRVKNEPYARPSTSATPPARSSSDIDRPDPSEEPEYKPDVVSDDDEYSDHKTTPKAKSKAKAKAKPKGKGSNDDAPASPFKAGKGEYNKGLLVALIFAPATPDWEVIGNNVGLSKSQTYDLWRKSLLSNLINNRSWSSSSGHLDTDHKIQVVLGVLEQTSINWGEVARYFPDKSKSQVMDVWRKVVLPRLKRGDGYE